jgi:hypothetical protein
MGIRAQDRFAAPEIFESAEPRLFEVEMGVGLNFARQWEGIKAKTGNNFLFELRLNRPSPVDIGLQLKMGNFIHGQRDGLRINSKFIRPALFVDYNRRVDKYTAFFAGVGFGGSFIENDAFYPLNSDIGLLLRGNDDSFAVTPRVGVKVMGCVRLTAEYAFAGGDYSCFGMNVGLIFGGSDKKNRARSGGK